MGALCSHSRALPRLCTRSLVPECVSPCGTHARDCPTSPPGGVLAPWPLKAERLPRQTQSLGGHSHGSHVTPWAMPRSAPHCGSSPPPAGATAAFQLGDGDRVVGPTGARGMGAMVEQNGGCSFGSSRGDKSHSKRRRLSTRGHVGTPRTGEQNPETVLTELRVGGTRPREKSQSTCGFSAWRENSDTIKLIPAEARANHSIKPAQNLMSDSKTPFIDNDENALVRNGKVHVKGGTVKRSPGPRKRRERLPKVVTFLLLCLTQIFTKQKPQRKPRTLCRKNEVFGSQVHRGLDARSMVADGLLTESSPDAASERGSLGSDGPVLGSGGTPHDTARTARRGGQRALCSVTPRGRDGSAGRARKTRKQTVRLRVSRSTISLRPVSTLHCGTLAACKAVGAATSPA